MFKRENYELESGKLMSYAFPGGYPLYYLCADNAVLCPECASRDECRSADFDKAWILVGAMTVEEEGEEVSCDRCMELI